MKVIAPVRFFTTVSVAETLNTVFNKTSLDPEKIAGFKYFTKARLEPKKQRK